MAARALLSLLVLMGCASPAQRQSHRTWQTICTQAPYHGGDTLPKPVLMALYTLPTFPSLTEVNVRCTR